MLCQIITNIKLIGIDGKRLSKLDFIFRDLDDPKDAFDVKSAPWYYDREGVVYALPTMEHQNLMLYLRHCTEEWVMELNHTPRQDFLTIRLFTKGRNEFVQTNPPTIVMGLQPGIIIRDNELTKFHNNYPSEN